MFGEPEPLGVDVYRDHMLAGEGELDGVAADAWLELGLGLKLGLELGLGFWFWFWLG